MSKNHKGSIRSAQATRRTHSGPSPPRKGRTCGKTFQGVGCPGALRPRHGEPACMTPRPDTPNLQKIPPSYAIHRPNQGLQQHVRGARPRNAPGAPVPGVSRAPGRKTSKGPALPEIPVRSGRRSRQTSRPSGPKRLPHPFPSLLMREWRLAQGHGSTL